MAGTEDFPGGADSADSRAALTGVLVCPECAGESLPSRLQPDGGGRPIAPEGMSTPNRWKHLIPSRSPRPALFSVESIGRRSGGW